MKMRMVFSVSVYKLVPFPVRFASHRRPVASLCHKFHYNIRWFCVMLFQQNYSPTQNRTMLYGDQTLANVDTTGLYFVAP